jgi:hypothetical protein
LESLLRAAKEKQETSSTVALPTLLYVSMGGKGPYASEGPGEMTERQMDEYLEKLHRHYYVTRALE